MFNCVVLLLLFFLTTATSAQECIGNVTLVSGVQPNELTTCPNGNPTLQAFCDTNSALPLCAIVDDVSVSVTDFTDYPSGTTFGITLDGLGDTFSFGIDTNSTGDVNYLIEATDPLFPTFSTTSNEAPYSFLNATVDGQGFNNYTAIPQEVVDAWIANGGVTFCITEPDCGEKFVFTLELIETPPILQVPCANLTSETDVVVPEPPVDSGDTLQVCSSVLRTSGLSTGIVGPAIIESTIEFDVTITDLQIVPADANATAEIDPGTGNLVVKVYEFPGFESLSPTDDFCYVVADSGTILAGGTNPGGNRPDVLQTINLSTGEIVDYGLTGTTNIEAIEIDTSTVPPTLYAINQVGATGVVGVLSTTPGLGTDYFTPLPPPLDTCCGWRHTTGADNVRDNSYTYICEPLDDVDSLSFHPYDGLLWAAHRVVGVPPVRDTLFAIDLTTNTCIKGLFGTDSLGRTIDWVEVDTDVVVPNAVDPVTNVTRSIQDIDDLAFSQDDIPVLFGVANQGIDPGGLVSIDYISKALHDVSNCPNVTFGCSLAPGASYAGYATLIGPFDVPDVEGMAFTADNRLMIVTGLNGGPTGANRVFQIDRYTGGFVDEYKGKVLDYNFGAIGDFESIACANLLPRVANTTSEVEVCVDLLIEDTAGPTVNLLIETQFAYNCSDGPGPGENMTTPVPVPFDSPELTALIEGSSFECTSDETALAPGECADVLVEIRFTEGSSNSSQLVFAATAPLLVDEPASAIVYVGDHLTLTAATIGDAPSGGILLLGDVVNAYDNLETDDDLVRVAFKVCADASYTGSELPLAEVLFDLQYLSGDAVTIETQVNATVQFGVETCFAIGDFVFIDLDRDGVQTAADLPIEGALVELYNATGALIATTTTDAAGFYEFTSSDVAALNPSATDAYTISVPLVQPGIIPSNVEPALTDNTVDNEADSDGVLSTDGTATEHLIPLTPYNGTDYSFDFGLQYVSEFVIGDLVQIDTNGDGLQDANDVPVGGTTVNLYDDIGMLIATTTTDASGFYLFNATLIEELVPGGDYTIGVVPPPGTVPTTELAGGDTSVDYNELTPGNGGEYLISYSAPLVPEDDLTLDFGFVPTGSSEIGNFVFLDDNADGLQTGELGLVSIVLYLEDSSGSVLASTTTDADGYYSFSTDAIDGFNPYQEDYAIVVLASDIPSGLFPSPPNVPADATDEIDSDLTAFNGTAHFIYGVTAPPPGEIDPSYDIGLTNTDEGEIVVGDFVFSDTDGDGIQDVGEPGIEGVTVQLFSPNGTLIAETTTDPSGEYFFDSEDITGFDPNGGEYTITVTIPDDGSTPSPTGQGTPNDDSNGVPDAGGTTVSTTFIAGPVNTEDLSLDFGFVPRDPLIVGDYVWLDADADGIQDLEEDGIAGVVVQLALSNGTIVATTETDITGLYTFSSSDYPETLLPGVDYVVSIAPITDLAPTLTDAAPDTVDSDIVEQGGFWTIPFTAPAYGEEDLTLDFGLVDPTATYGDKVWLDLDGDGTQDPGEPGVEGVEVQLQDATGALIGTTLTDADGLYQFSSDDYPELLEDEPLQFVVVGGQTPLAGTQPTTPEQGVDSADSNGIPTGEDSVAVFTPFGPGANDQTFDFGFEPVGESIIGDRVWFDDDTNGVQDAGEIGVVGFPLALYNSDGDLLATTLTDINGDYFFSTAAISGFEPLGADYEIRALVADLPSGTVFTTPNTGLDGADSDATPLDAATYVISGITAPSGGSSDLTFDIGIKNELEGEIQVGDFIWFDENGDGIQGEDEPPIPGATVQLLSPNGTVLAEVTTDANGEYLFDSELITGFDPNGGDYTIVVDPSTIPSGLLASPEGAGTDADLDSSGGYSVAFTAPPVGTVDLTYDFGYAPPHCSPIDKCHMTSFDPVTFQCVQMEVVCDDGDACTRDFCLPASGCSCEPELSIDCTPPCVTDADCLMAAPEPVGCAFQCVDFQCVYEDHDPNCNDNNPCTNNTCVAGQCEFTEVELFTPCSDPGSGCSGECRADSTCVCLPEPCVPTTACQISYYDPTQHGCAEEPKDCNDNNACTADTCDDITGCANTRIPCDDGDVCTYDHCDVDDGCVHHPLTCNAPDRCHTSVCGPVLVNGTATGQCIVEEISCDDGDACTLDACDGALGCRSVSIDGCRVCDSAADCNDNDVCTSETCTDGLCFYGPGTTCEESDDDNLCVDKVCHPTDGCIEKVKDCANTLDKVNVYGGVQYDSLTGDRILAPACEIAMCVPSTGECMVMPQNCTTEDQCKISFCDATTNRCVHHDRVCTPTNECMEVSCDSALGCQETPLLVVPPNACQLAQCVPGTGIVYTDRVCDDGDPCTVDKCNKNTGCVFVPMVCDDGNQCTINDRCEAGVCVSDPAVCPSDADNLCEVAQCSPTDGCGVKEKFCAPAPSLMFVATCDPGSGECVNVEKDCDDLNPCTTDSVRENGDCMHVAVPECCQANDECPVSNKCINWSCDLVTNTCMEASAVNCCSGDTDCDDGLACTTDHCQVETGTCFNNPIVCEQTADLCDTTVCREGECVIEPITCDDANACTLDTCNPSTGECANELLPAAKCDDGNACTLDQCDRLTAECVHTDCPCDDGDPCTDDTCDPHTGDCIYTPIDVDDGNAMTVDSCDADTGEILHEEFECDDGCPCTIDTPNTIKGCIYTPVDFSAMANGNPCVEYTCDELTGEPVRNEVENCCRSNLECHAGSELCVDEFCDYNTNRCSFRPRSNCCEADKECFDNNKCTTDTCKTETGECYHEPITCEAPDAAHIAQCFPDRGCVITPIDCADDNPCTIDSVMLINNGTEFMCSNEPIICEQPDDLCLPRNVCHKGECVASEELPCDDGNPCTDDHCSPTAEFKFQADKVQCTHTPCDCRDTNPCTTDTCDQETGECIHVRSPFSECCLADDDCNDFNRCTHNFCDLHTNTCRTEPIDDCCLSDKDCADENPCTLWETCDTATNRCVLKQKECDDGNACTIDSCNIDTGLCQTHSNATTCTGTDICKNYKCDKFAGCVEEPVDCSHLITGPCQTTACSPARGCVVIDKDCDDNDWCTISACNAFTGQCENDPRVCDDGNPCTQDLCDSENQRCYHPARDCAAENDCTDPCQLWQCVTETGQCVAEDKICQDGNACTKAHCKPDHGCVTEPIHCDDGDSCTIDTCVDGLLGGCHHERIEGCCECAEDCDDHDECTTDSCVHGVCHHTNCCDTPPAPVPSVEHKKHHARIDYLEARRRSLLSVDEEEDDDYEADPVCGNKIVEAGEQCDTSTSFGLNLIYRCSETCERTLSPVGIAFVVLSALCVGLALLTCCLSCIARRRRKSGRH